MNGDESMSPTTNGSDDKSVKIDVDAARNAAELTAKLKSSEDVKLEEAGRKSDDEMTPVVEVPTPCATESSSHPLASPEGQNSTSPQIFVQTADDSGKDSTNSPKASSSSTLKAEESKTPSSSPAASPSVPVSASTPVPPVRSKKRKVTELRCGEVRWFYQEPKTTSWIPFIGHDSLILEIKYRAVKKLELDEQTTCYISENDVVRQEAVVLNGLYRLSDDFDQIVAIYWKDDSKEIRRGTWFTTDYQPMDSLLADVIDRHHLQNFRGQVVPEGTTVFSKSESSNKPLLTELHTEHFDIRWSSVLDIYMSDRKSALLRFWSKSISIRRGYEKEAEWSDAAPEVSHLILVVHGIGQKGYENLIAQNANQVRDGVVAAMEKCYPDIKSRPMFLPVEWRSSLVLDNGITDSITIPKMSSMRASLNSTAMDVMYYQSPLFRTEIIRGVVRQLNRVYRLFKANNPNFDGGISIFGHSLGSVICYDILTGYSPLLLYDKFVTKTIDEHLQAHDAEDTNVLKAMRNLRDARQGLQNQFEGGIQHILVSNEDQLDFKTKYLFAVGSPLGVFLAMRGATCHDLTPNNTHVDRIFNIFHPYDPVAYRLEPFFASEYRHIRPVRVYAVNDLRARNCYDNVELEVYKAYMKKLKNQAKAKKNQQNGGSKEKAINEVKSANEEVDDEDEDEFDSEDFDARSGCSSPRSVSPPPGEKEKVVKKGWFSSTFSSSTKKTAQVEAPVEVAKEAETELPLYERILGSATRVPHRIDIQLQPGLTEKSYWSVLKAHFSYWTNADLALFIANCIYARPAKLEEAKPV
ncbi:hypothetical protein WR25_21561 isoform A [Diploscapter pachys]|uniref:DDHD domain-containing protein n=1 Tax=Diploscapter pachys TaxID=2018661 RepID=A0A2A2JNN4_9BILA|nr:hypothetical protein WR25_21561 isoform A [Diploscapter pachys]